MIHATALGPVEVGQLLGIHPTSVRNAITRQEIPAICVGRLYRIPSSWVREALGITVEQLDELLDQHDGSAA